MQKPEKKDLKLPVSPPLSTQVKVILVTAFVIGGVGFAFGMVSLGMIMGQKPVTNNYGGDTYNYNNYTTYTTYYNTTYVYNNATGQRMIYNCCLFDITLGSAGTWNYFFNLTLEAKTVLTVVYLSFTGNDVDISNVYLQYNLSIDGAGWLPVALLGDFAVQKGKWYLFDENDAAPYGSGRPLRSMRRFWH